MKTIETTVFLMNGSHYYHIFFSEFEMDQYYEDNYHIIDLIEVVKINKNY